MLTWSVLACWNEVLIFWMLNITARITDFSAFRSNAQEAKIK